MQRMKIVRPFTKARSTTVYIFIFLALLTSCSKAPPPSQQDVANPQVATSRPDANPQSKLANLTRFSDSGDAAAKFELAMLYWHGEFDPKGGSVPIDRQKGLALIEEAERMGHMLTREFLAFDLLGSAGYSDQNWERARRLAESLVVTNRGAGYLVLALILHNGELTRFDDEWERSIDDHLKQKIGSTEPDWRQRLLLEQEGRPEHERQRKALQTDPIRQALQHFEQAANLGETFAADRLAEFYREGMHGLAKDQERASYWAEKARANSALQDALLDGRDSCVGTASQEVACYEKNISAGSIGDITWLGKEYIDGKGVPKDATKGLELLNVAASLNDHWAQWKLMDLHGQDWKPSNGVQFDAVLAYAWANIGAARGTSSGWRNFAGYMRDTTDRRGYFANGYTPTPMTMEDFQEAQRISSAWRPGEILRRERNDNATSSDGVTGAEPKLDSFGTMFFVNGDGYAVTNAHVADMSCKSLRQPGREDAALVVARDTANDLAILRWSQTNESYGRLAAPSDAAT